MVVSFCLRLILVLALLSVVSTSWSHDVVRMNTGNQANDLRTIYKMKALKRALMLSEKEFGPYEIKIFEIPTTPKRAISEVKSSRSINLFIGITSLQWEQETIPIRIPLRRGILDYRLLAINKQNADLFSNLNSLSELKKLAAGLRVGWVTTQAFNAQHFKVFELESLDGLYHMLDSKMVDYIPRGINEVYDEISVRKLSNTVVADNVMLYMPAPTYIFVSPTEPRLAMRLEAGLEAMVADGSLKAQFYDFYADDLKRANIKNRRAIFTLNPLLPPETPIEREELWFAYDKEQRH